MKANFKTLRELKQQLPDVLDKIEFCRTIASIESFLSDAYTKGEFYGLYTEPDRVKYETYRNARKYKMEAEWLQEQVDKLRKHSHL